jgi:uncharacterized membrane protein
MTGGRRRYIDWLRGAGVLVMIEAHVMDAWTRVEERSRPFFADALIVGGMGAPTFLFLAGMAMPLAIGQRLANGATDREATARAFMRGLQIFGLAFLFRLQAFVLSGSSASALLKVDILNIMGVAMLAGAALWAAGRGPASRIALFAGSAALIAMATPPVRVTPLLAPLPDALEAYLRPIGAPGTFVFFPWAGFLLAGVVVGVLIDRAREGDRRLMLWLAAAGPAIALASYAASFLPAIYARSSFWTSSPTFFFLRVGLLISLLPLAYAWEHRRQGAWLAPLDRAIEDFGRASLFVYWIHVEMVYGVVAYPLHKRLSLEEMALAYLAFTAFLLGLVRLKQTLTVRWRGRPVLATR